MHLADQPVRQREPISNASEAVLKGRDVVRDLDHIVDGHTWGVLELEEQEIRERRLGAFDLGRQHGLAAHVGVQEEMGIRQQCRHAVEAPQRYRGLLERELARACQLERRLRWQGVGDERPDLLATGAGHDVSASLPPIHDRLIGSHDIKRNASFV